MTERCYQQPSQYLCTPLSQISPEGAYVSRETGRLYQIPQSALKEGHSPVFNVLGPGGDEVVVRLSSNPFSPIEKLRFLASQANVEPRF